MPAMSAILLMAGLNREVCFLEEASVQPADFMHVVGFEIASTGEDWSIPDNGKTYIMLLLVS